jgi:hypothetical protein
MIGLMPLSRFESIEGLYIHIPTTTTTTTTVGESPYNVLEGVQKQSTTKPASHPNAARGRFHSTLSNATPTRTKSFTMSRRQSNLLLKTEPTAAEKAAMLLLTLLSSKRKVQLATSATSEPVRLASERCASREQWKSYDPIFLYAFNTNRLSYNNNPTLPPPSSHRHRHPLPA